jgi:hypothetical protein
MVSKSSNTFPIDFQKPKKVSNFQKRNVQYSVNQKPRQLRPIINQEDNQNGGIA